MNAPAKELNVPVVDNQSDIKVVQDNFEAFERLFAQFLEERADTDKPLLAGDGLELNASVIASFTDDQWTVFETARAGFYSKVAALGDVAELAHMACCESYPHLVAAKFEGFSSHMVDSLKEILDSFEGVERLIHDAKERGES